MTVDERVREHADVLVDWSARIDAGDDVVVSVAEGAHDLAVAVGAALGERGANPVFTYDSGEVSRAYLRARDHGFDADPAHELALVENADAYLRLGGGRNAAATADVPGETRRAHARATEGVREARFDTDWVSTVHPTRALAQRAGMSFEAYREFVYDAVLRDWSALADEMDRLKRLLDDGSEVRVRTDRGTDLTLSVERRTAVNSAASVAYDSHNLPSGEVFTAPATVDGEIRFDVPTTVEGTRVADARFRFEDGEAVEFDAGTDAARETLADLLDTDEGARRVGELGVGMNRGIDRPTDNVLFDEKMAGTVHLALGRAYDACLPDGETGNESAIHVDLLADVRRPGSRVEIDGETVQRAGVFRWEEGFDEGGASGETGPAADAADRP